MIQLTKPRAILFDWDNTLVDTWPTIHKALNTTLRHMDHPEWSLQKVMANIKKSMRDSFPEMFGVRWEEAAAHYQQSYRAIHLDDLQPLPAAEDMLRALPEDMFVAVVSNKRGPTLRQEIEHIGWNDLFDIAIGSDDAVRDKPHPDPALLALEAFDGQCGADVWFVGDTIIDLECAQEAGATPILYGDHKTSNNSYDGFSFAAQVRDQRELKELILKHL
jgi:phosphoglycolate phosphatase